MLSDLKKQTMKTRNAFMLTVLVAALSVSAFSQAAPQFKRTTTKTDRLDFGAGGTIEISGAPVGSIRVEGWKNREIQITAEIQVEANSEEDLVKLGAVTTFVLEESLGRTGIISVGTHDKKYMKQVGKKFPKQLLSMPTRIDYVIKVPQFTDLQIDGGVGDLTVEGVEGVFRLNFLETNAKISLVGGSILGIFGKGNVDLLIPRAGWRGRFADVSLNTGDMSVQLPNGMNAEVDATILRNGKIENGYAGLKPRVRKAEFTEKLIEAKAGVGGVPLKFTVGDGTLTLSSFGG